MKNNSLLQLKGQLHSRRNTSKPGTPNLPIGQSVKFEHIFSLLNNLKSILSFWEKNTLIDGALVSVHYTQIVAKSNRVKGLFVNNSVMSANDSIRGSKFELIGGKINHIFTHYISLEVLQETIRRLSVCADIVIQQYNGQVRHDDINNLIIARNLNSKQLSQSNFIQIIVDTYYIKKFDIDQDVSDLEENAIITIYRTNKKTVELLNKLGIDLVGTRVLDETTILLDPNQFKLLKETAPYLISMQTKDITKLSKEDIEVVDSEMLSIPTPQNEPIVGVIDTLFYKDVYFKEWVIFENMVNPNIETDSQDCNHGTAVSSIIVDGPAINPNLDDGCGRFRVKHFGVATKNRFSSFTVLKAIREIVARNSDIKVWNLSLGSILEIHPNFISPEAAELDKIQFEYDVIFIIAGTNVPKNYTGDLPMRIGAPADSINSLVVNSVDFKDEAASYHRVGPVLSFFHKPDISYYGGDENHKIKVCTPFGEGHVCGTSFAAPWISRKMAYLVYNMGLSREVAKALLIDSAARWDRQDNSTHSIGYGVVPIRIEDILTTSSDEIRFIMTGIAKSYETYTYEIPVPHYLDKCPFYARATLCYFTQCSRNQGVDYTNTEMDVHFGRVKEKKNIVEIKSINHNMQGNQGFNILYEGTARQLYRKWDNIKHISESIKERKIPKKKYAVGNWGLSIKTKERLSSFHDKELPFGVVVTLKEMNGQNRIDDFIKLCMMRGWIVNKIDIHHRIDIFNKAEEEIRFN